MLGNLRGWMISAAIVVMFGVIFYTQGTAPTVSKSTGQLVKLTAPTKLPTDPKTLLPDGSDDCNAGELYRQAIADYLGREREYDNVLRIQGSQYRQAAQQLKGVDLVLQAAKCSKMDLYASKPSEVANFDRGRPGLEALQKIGAMTNKLAASLAQEDRAKANEYARAVFLLGRRLYDERVVFDEYRVGLDLMANAAHTMATHTMKGEPGAQQMADFSKEAGGYIEQNFKHLWTAISQIESPGQMLPWPGDILDVAKSPGVDPMWRTEAALKLGRMRWMKSVTPADQVGANRLLKQLADDPSAPLSVRAAAAAGRDLTVERFRMY